MNLIFGAVKTVAGAFFLFTVARISYSRLTSKAGWVWVGLVTLLAIGNMLIHRWLGSSINPPFFTAVLFAITLLGHTADNVVAEGRAPAETLWFKRGAIAVAIGTVIGWLSYGTVMQVGAV